VNKLGVKWALVIGSMSFPIEGSAYYCNSKFGNQWVSCRQHQQMTPRNYAEGLTNCDCSISFLVEPSPVLVLVAGTSLKPEPS